MEFLSKSEYKALRFLLGQSSLTSTEIRSYKNGKFLFSFKNLLNNGLIEQDHKIINHLYVGNEDRFHITDQGLRAYEIYKERHRWFDLKYVITQIVVPIVIAVTSTLLTIKITSI